MTNHSRLFRSIYSHFLISFVDADYERYVVHNGDTEVVDDLSSIPLVRLIRDAADIDGPEIEDKINDMVSDFIFSFLFVLSRVNNSVLTLCCWVTSVCDVEISI